MSLGSDWLSFITHAFVAGFFAMLGVMLARGIVSLFQRGASRGP